MTFYCVQNLCKQDQFSIKWQPEDKHFGDYSTKHNPPSYQNKCDQYIWSMHFILYKAVFC